MKIREVLEMVTRTLECRSVAEETVNNKTETRNYEGSDGESLYSPYVNRITLQENTTKGKAYKAIDECVVIGWIGQIDGQIRCEILREDPEKVVLPRWEEDTLAVPDAYCSVYYYYCLAMAALTVGEVSDYHRIMAMHEDALSLYARSVIRKRK